MQQDKISDLQELPSPDANDIMEITDISAGNSRHVKVENLVKGFADNSLDGAKLQAGTVTAAKTNFSTYTPTLSNGWSVSPDGQTATRRLSTTGRPAFGAIGSGSNWTQVWSAGTYPDGFTTSNSAIEVFTLSNDATPSVFLTTNDSSTNQIRGTNTASGSVGNTSTSYTARLKLTKVAS